MRDQPESGACEVMNAAARLNLQFSLGAIGLLTTMLAVLLGLTSQFGLTGFACGVDACAAMLIAAANSSWATFRPISNHPTTLTEVVTIVAICLILHGLAMPSIESCPRRQRPAPVAVPPAPSGLMSSRPLQVQPYSQCPMRRGMLT